VRTGLPDDGPTSFSALYAPRQLMTTLRRSSLTLLRHAEATNTERDGEPATR
jgi:hypothetical protein